MSKIGWIAMALVAGAFLPLQAGLNARLGKALESPVSASFISFVVGAMTMGIYVLATRQPLTWSGLRAAPTYAWIGGALGAFYVTVVLLALPRLGAALTFGLVVLGQMVISVALDHGQILVPQQHALSSWRLLGVALIVGGVVLIRRF